VEKNKTLSSEIRSIRSQIVKNTSDHDHLKQRAQERGQSKDDNVISLLEKILNKNDPLKKKLSTKETTLSENLKGIPWSSGQNLTLFFEQVELVMTHLAESHSNRSKSSAEGSKYPTSVTVYSEDVPIPNKTTKHGRPMTENDIIRSKNLLFFFRVISILSQRANGFVSLFHYTKNDEAHKTFVNLNTRVWEDKDSLPSKPVIVKWIVYVIDSLTKLKNAMGYQKMELDTCLSPENFGKVFYPPKHQERRSFFDPEPKHRGHCAGGGGASAETSKQPLDKCISKFHQLMQGATGALPTIGINGPRSQAQYELFCAIKDHPDFEKLQLTITKFLEENGVISIFDQKGTKYFRVLPLSKDE
jgi:hypothetical protein